MFGKGTCSLSDTEGSAEVFAFVSTGADRKANTWRVAAHSNEVTALPLSPLHSAMMPSVLETISPLLRS